MKKTIEKGYTLIELVIVVAIIGIMSAVAVPSYLDYVVRTNRAEAKDMLTQVIYELERYNTRKRTYTTNMADLGFIAVDGKFLTQQKLYSLSIAACTGSTIGKCAIVTAQPVEGGSQKDDGALTIDTRGQKTGKWKK